MSAHNTAYSVKLGIFEGPLDMLLHLIKKNEVDIYDIPIATIVDQYLEYIEMMKSMSLDLAGEYLVMAATLVHIKSKMLLPVEEEAEEAEEGEDPREALVRKLLIYQRFKESAEELKKRLVLGRDVFSRGMPLPLGDLEEGEEEPGLVDVSLMDLIEAFRDILKRAPKAYSLDLTVDRFSITDKVNHIMEVIGKNKSVVFKELFPGSAPRGEVIVTFLAVLEVVKLQLIRVHQSEEGVIRLYLAAPSLEQPHGAL
jgi:segregation and condensation protein A